MDYLAHPCAPLKHFDTFPLLFDLENARAVVVEDGKAPVVFTASADVANVVARAIDYPEPWTFDGGIVGERTSYAEVIQKAEKITGKPAGISGDPMVNGTSHNMVLTKPQVENSRSIASSRRTLRKENSSHPGFPLTLLISPRRL